ncbi:uncharacterized protein LOC117178530 [Belonocnema kinseyi]|uniref:uncharacterized protein LOC117178530 n=1 Tax=Belonocnema kinseyi TaxID=2817044 RepID=UPI00143D7D53|nr:uncharacterized protein LOC117178530 [Belonocnema kinseyi]
MSISVGILLIGITTVILSAGDAIQIKSLELPSLIRNGSGPVEFVCIYELLNTDTGLVVNWYRNAEKIYQWIPPLAPQDMGIVKGLIEYPWENINRPHTHSILRINKVTTNLAGDYTCSVTTFQDEATKSAKMIVYVPVNDVKIETENHNETHMNILCETYGAHPPPNLKIFIAGIEIEGEISYSRNYDEDAWIRHTSITNYPKDSTLIECEISIPEVDYKRREKLFYEYYPCAGHSSSLFVSYSMSDIEYCMINSSSNESGNK